METITLPNGLKKLVLAHVPIGSKISGIQYFDRSQKVSFQCPTHHKSKWRSKDPYVSASFPFSDATVDCKPSCTVRISDYVTIETYRPTRRV